jgi:major vault protein
LEYCILLGEDGEKRFVKGPDVVFPEPTEQFINKKGGRKFKAIELNENSGIYIKVIADYDDYKAGDELFITGKEQKLYYPRAEHAIIRYGNENVQYGMAIPTGEGRYTLNRESGAIDLVEGPKILLPDPRIEVLIRRVLTDKQSQLWYPGNVEALRLNQELRKFDKTGSGFVTTRGGQSRNDLADMLGSMTSTVAAYSAVASDFVGDEFERKKTYTPTESLVLDTKYEGAINVGVWPGYAIQLVNKKGDRKVVEGPRNVLLRYEEDLSVLSLSTGKPKTTDTLFETVYLKIKGNKVGDVIEVETKDMVRCQVKISLLVNFEGNHDKWFDIDNYVKLLTDHVRSLMKDKVKRLSIEEFYTNAITVIRDTVLGVKSEEGDRTGLKFEENDMRVYDVEILDVKVGDRHIAELLMEAQEQAVSDNLTLIRKQRELDSTKKLEAIERSIREEKAQTTVAAIASRRAMDAAEHEAQLRTEEERASVEAYRQEMELAMQEGLKAITVSELDRDKARDEQRLGVAAAELEQYGQRLRLEAETAKLKGEAISPQLVAAMQAFSDKALLRELAESMGALAIANGTSPVAEIQKLLNNTPLADVVSNLTLGKLLGGTGTEDA